MSGLNNYIGDFILSGKNLILNMSDSDWRRGKIRQTSQIAIRKIYNTYSPWVVAEEVTRLAEQGNAKSIESRKITDLSQFLFQDNWSDYFSLLSTIQRNVHVVNDPNLIKEGLKKGRSSERYAIYPTLINRIVGVMESNNKINSDNMLLCPTKEHRRLRAPFEMIFSEKNIQNNFLKELAHYCLVSSSTPGLKVLDEEIRSIWRKNGDLSLNEFLSSKSILKVASDHTTSTSLRFIKNLLYDNGEYADRILQEWEDRFGELEENSLHYDVIDHAWKSSNYNFLEKLIIFVDGGIWNKQPIEPSKNLHLFVMEALRLYPVVPQIARIAKEKFQLGDTEIQAGDVVMFNIMGYQRNAKEWTDPLKFNPQRFLEKDTVPNIIRGPLLNFSHGTEHCIGKNLAKYTLLFCATKTALKIALEKRKDSKMKSSKEEIPLSNTGKKEDHSYFMTPPFIS